MALSANDLLNDIIDVSKTLLQHLETSSIEQKKSTSDIVKQDDEKPVDTTALLTLMAHREESIHQLFEQFSRKELQIHHEKLQTVSTLDGRLVEKVNSVQKSAKSSILTLKKNKKAINLYQKQ